MNKERLIKVADFLDTVVYKVPKKFKMTLWARRPFRRDAAKENFSCQTAACIAGWATAIPEFRKLGFKLVRNEDDRGWVHPSFGELEDDNAVKEFFGFGNSADDRVYSSIFYGPWRTPREAAGAIRMAVAMDSGEDRS